MADDGQTAVLAAEEMAFGGTTFDVPIDRPTVGRTIAEITSGGWWRSCALAVTVEVPRRGTRSSTARHRLDCVEIRVSDEQLTLATIAHELGHALAGVDRGHDSTFRAAYVDVVAVLGGAANAAALWRALAAMGVAPGGRLWPVPYRVDGDGFVITTGGSSSVPTASSPAKLTATPMRRSR